MRLRPATLKDSTPQIGGCMNRKLFSRNSDSMSTLSTMFGSFASTFRALSAKLCVSNRACRKEKRLVGSKVPHLTYDLIAAQNRSSVLRTRRRDVGISPVYFRRPCIAGYGHSIGLYDYLVTACGNIRQTSTLLKRARREKG